MLPVRFEDDRIFLHLRTSQGLELRLLTDTGGGGVYLTPQCARRHGLRTATSLVDGTVCVVAGVPDLIPRHRAAMAGVSAPLSVHQGSGIEDCDGLLGQSGFDNRVWRFDHVHQRLELLDGAESGPEPAAVCSLGFQRRPDGSRANAFPRISAAVDGERLDLLLDTGATAYPTRFGGRGRGTSFIAASVFARWRARHAHWRVIGDGDARFHEPMIEVPTVRVAGLDVGPAWFTRRPDRNFHEFMSAWMDRRVDGALGGSVLRYFVVVVDHPREVARFGA